MSKRSGGIIGCKYKTSLWHLTLLALDYSPSDRPDCHKNSLRFTKIKFQEKAFERHAEHRERSAQKNKKYIYLVGSFTISAQGA